MSLVQSIQPIATKVLEGVLECRGPTSSEEDFTVAAYVDIGGQRVTRVFYRPNFGYHLDHAVGKAVRLAIAGPATEGTGGFLAALEVEGKVHKEPGELRVRGQGVAVFYWFMVGATVAGVFGGIALAAGHPILALGIFALCMVPAWSDYSTAARARRAAEDAKALLDPVEGSGRI